jgi:putative effector of murein hydrolase
MPECRAGHTTLAIIGVAVAPAVFRLLGVRDERARGIALRVAAHAIGLSRAFQSGHQVAGAFAGVATGLTGLLTAVAVPIVLMLGSASHGCD